MPPTFDWTAAAFILNMIIVIAGAFSTVYTSNKNRIIGNEQRKHESELTQAAINDLKDEFTTTQKRLEDKIDDIGAKVDDHAKFDGRIARLEGMLFHQYPELGQRNTPPI